MSEVVSNESVEEVIPEAETEGQITEAIEEIESLSEQEIEMLPVLTPQLVGANVTVTVSLPVFERTKLDGEKEYWSVSSDIVIVSVVFPVAVTTKVF